MSDLRLTHSRAACFRTCPRKHELRYELGLKPDVESEALRVGSAFARAVEADAKGLDVEGAIGALVADPYELALVAAMFHQHRALYGPASVEHVAAELPFDIPLVNPDTGKASTLWRLCGVIDRIVRLPDGRLAIMEYKTTSRDFAPGADYWTRLHLDYQLSIYLIAARAMGYDIATILYDVTRRPAQRPLKATPPESRRYTKAGALDARQRENDETPEEYAARVSDAMAADPVKHFARIEIARLDSDLEETRWELWSQQLAMREAQRSGRWWRNPDACFGLSYTCEYVGICQSRDLATRTPAGFVRVDDVHAELARHATGGGQPTHATTGASPSVSE